MTSKIDPRNHSMYPVSDSRNCLVVNDSGQDNHLVNAIDPKLFELLSAYIDGEATPAERRQVNEWLDHDSEVKNLYLHLLRIRQNLQQMPVPKSTQPVSETVEKVFWLLDKRRYQKMAIVGGGAIAALCVAALSGLVPGMPSVTQLAKSLDRQPESKQLMIALNRPIVPIPKAAIAVPMNPDEQPSLSTDRPSIDLIYKNE
jgi:anti-sigma factor RsiW